MSLSDNIKIASIKYNTEKIGNNRLKETELSNYLSQHNHIIDQYTYVSYNLYENPNNELHNKYFNLPSFPSISPYIYGIESKHQLMCNQLII